MIACAVALVLLLDASASINANDWRLQVEGHAAALEAPEVIAAVEREPIAVMALAFADTTAPMLGWRLLTTAEDARAAAQELRQARRGGGMGTEIPHALQSARSAFSDAPCRPDLEVIDLVTDGEADAAATAQARAYAEAEGVRINALGVGRASAADWLREHAITPGGFVMHAATWGDFARAVRRKITIELSSIP